MTARIAAPIIDYLVFARGYIAECEERYGYEEVESLLDSCHALMNYGVDRYKRPSPLSMAEEFVQSAEPGLDLIIQISVLRRHRTFLCGVRYR